jgi:hypothetical protein
MAFARSRPTSTSERASWLPGELPGLPGREASVTRERDGGRRSLARLSGPVIEDDSDAKPLVWPMPLLIGWGVACVSVPWLHLHAVAAIYQAIGVGFTFLGLAVIGERVRHAKEVAMLRFAKARSRLKAWSARRREQLAMAWARLIRKRPAIIRPATATARASASGDVSVKVTRQRVDRDVISDRDWLAYLDDRLESVFDLSDGAEKRRYEERQEIYRRIGVQRDELRAEIRRETRRGWQFVAWGLGYSFVGIVLGALT